LKAVSYSFTGKNFHFTDLLLWWWYIINAKGITFKLKREIFPIYSRVEKNKKFGACAQYFSTDPKDIP
jgi:hypothetical protein